MRNQEYFWNSDAVRAPASATNNGMANPTGRNASSVMEFSPAPLQGHTYRNNAGSYGALDFVRGMRR